MHMPRMKRFCSSLASTAAVFTEEHAPRAIRKLYRECTIAKQCYEEGTKSSLKKLVNIARQSSGDVNEASSRVTAYGAALALKLNRLEDSQWFLAKTTRSPPVLQRSLLVVLLTKSGKFDEALDEMEKTMNEEDAHFNSINSHISDQALDELHRAIKEHSDSNLLMKRFRRLQKAVTQFGRRTEASIDEILASPLSLEVVVSDRGATEAVELTDKVISQTPHFLSSDDVVKETV